jgi:CubicO group peptidase (beta-lactamase class C family)
MASAKAERPFRGSHAPGTHWYYNNWDFNVLGTIYKTFTGRTVFEGLNEELARPLGFEDFRPDRDTENIFEWASDHPAYVMRLSARDLARVGLLMARSGHWEERQVVSTRWVAESTASYSNASPGVGYGYLWWVGQDSWSCPIAWCRSTARTG